MLFLWYLYLLLVSGQWSLRRTDLGVFLPLQLAEAQTSADSLGRAEMPVCVCVFLAQAGHCFCRQWAQLLAVFLVLLCWHKPR